MNNFGTTRPQLGACVEDQQAYLNNGHQPRHTQILGSQPSMNRDANATQIWALNPGQQGYIGAGPVIGSPQGNMSQPPVNGFQNMSLNVVPISSHQDYVAAGGGYSSAPLGGVWGGMWPSPYMPDMSRPLSLPI